MSSLLMKRVSVVVGAVTALSFILAPSASADTIYRKNWSGYITNGEEGQESERWEDGDWTSVTFYTCQSKNHSSVQVAIYQSKDFQPDPDYGWKLYTNCFTGRGKKSEGAWSNIPGLGIFYFQLGEIDEGRSNTLDAAFSVDRTKAD